MNEINDRSVNSSTKIYVANTNPCSLSHHKDNIARYFVPLLQVE